MNSPIHKNSLSIHSRVAGVCCLLLAFLSTDARLHAEKASEAIPPPVAPFVAVPKSGTQWTIQIKYIDPTSKTGGSAQSTEKPSSLPYRPEKVIASTANQFTRLDISWSDSTQSTVYIYNAFVMRKSPTSEKILVSQIEDGKLVAPLYTRGYLATGWMTAQDYVGIESINKELVYKFHRDGKMPADVDSSPTAIPDMSSYAPALTAWIRVADKSPVRVQLGSEQYEFSVPQSFSGHVELPPSFQAEKGRIDSELQILEQLRRNN